MKIHPIQILKRAVQLLVSHIFGVVTFIVLFALCSAVPHFILMYINTSNTFSAIETIIRFGIGLYVVPALLRVFIKYLLVRGSGSDFTKQSVIQEIQPDNSVRFMILHVIVLLPVVAFWATSSHFMTQSLSMLLAISPVLVALLYIYSRLFLSEIIMTDLSEKIDNSLKKAFSLSQQYPINSMLVVVLLQMIMVIHVPYIHWDLMSRYISTTYPLLIQVITFSAWSLVVALSYCVTTAFYVEIKQQKSVPEKQ